ncbi:MAG: DoxX family protein [Bdellovibrionales bacterium]
MNYLKAILISPVVRDVTSTRVSSGLFVLRLVAGAAFVTHGSGKITSPMGWMGPEAPVPGVFQALAAVAEFGGGLAWILGLFTPLASLGLIITMSVAAFFHISRGDGFVNGYELASVYLAISLLLFLAGPGRFSLDALISDRTAVRKR